MPVNIKKPEKSSSKEKAVATGNIITKSNKITTLFFMIKI